MNSLRKNYAALVVALLFLGAALAARSAPQRTGQGEEKESQLMSAVGKEKDYTKKLRLLDQWKEKYPESAHGEERTRIYMWTYLRAKRWLKAFEAAQDLIKIRPRDAEAHFLVVYLTPFAGVHNRQVQNAGENSANLILSGGVEKPGLLGEAEWEQIKNKDQEAAHRALGWIAKGRGENQRAAAHFFSALRMNPSDAQVSLWLGESVLAQRNPVWYGLALFCLARAAEYEGKGSLSPAVRKQTDDLLTASYTKFFWTEKGLDKLKESAKLQAFPPVTFLLLPACLPRKLLASSAADSLFFFVPWAVLFGASVIMGKRATSEEITILLFNLSGFCLWVGILIMAFVADLIIRGDHVVVAMVPADNFFHFVGSFPGGWSRSNAVAAFSTALSAAIVWCLAQWIAAVDSGVYAFICAVSTFVGVVYAVGITLVLGTTAQVLGIVATAIGILVGIKTLMGKKAG
jgi:tetratricopeptide (TPR) repeat protein